MKPGKKVDASRFISWVFPRVSETGERGATSSERKEIFMAQTNKKQGVGDIREDGDIRVRPVITEAGIRKMWCNKDIKQGKQTKSAEISRGEKADRSVHQGCYRVYKSRGKSQKKKKGRKGG